jgi:hypothetical protein
MLKPEDFDKTTYEFFKDLSREGSVIVTRLEKSGCDVVVYGIKNDSPSIRSTENGPVLSEEKLGELEGREHLFIPEGSYDKEFWGETEKK